jgi:hypothetical protein
MRLPKKITLFWLINSLIILSINAYSGDGENAQKSVEFKKYGSCEQILKHVCVECHYETRICQKLGKKSERGWQRTIERMVKKGAKLHEHDNKPLLKCLTNQSSEIQKLCEEFSIEN